MRFLGLIPYRQALLEQDEALARVRSGGPSEILGFECPLTITLGTRSDQRLDLNQSTEWLKLQGVEVVRVDRGGQATLHGPGQLVIFPVVNMRRFGARRWVDLLARVTSAWAQSVTGGPLTFRAEAPGLYDPSGAKVAALGLRIKGGISTHGLAVNVRNDLSTFSWIRPCGVSAARLACLRTERPLPELFSLWLQRFNLEVDNGRDLIEFNGPSTDVRL